MNNMLFTRKTLDEVCSVPDEIIDVYVVEHHIWADGGTTEAKQQRQPELKTIRDFLIEPVRPLLNDVLRQLAAPFDPSSKTTPVGQGWWIQAEFGSGKSHLLSFIGALALGNKDAWEVVRQKETEMGKGRRESIYQFYENGIAKKSSGQSKGILVVVKILVGQGGGTIGKTETWKRMTEYILDAVHEQYYAENGKTISLYPVELLADRFENKDFDRYQKDFAKFLKDPRFFDDEQQEDLEAFLKDLRGGNPSARRDCGDRLWRFYKEYLETTPNIPAETEDVLTHMVKTLVADGYEGVLLILDEVSLFMKSRNQEQRDDDEKTLVVLSNRLAKHACLPVWTICSAQQAIESRMSVKNIIANDRLKHVSLLQDERNYYDIVLTRVRAITDPLASEAYFEDYRRGFTWPDAAGQSRFAQYFPFFPDAIDALRAISYHLTTARSSIHFMHQTRKTQCKVRSNELISLWQMFNDVVSYTEDPSGTTAGIAAISSKFHSEWRAYEAGRKAIGQAIKGHLKVYASRCEKILKTLFMYEIAKLASNGLSVEQIMNCVMEWKDHDKGQESDVTDNLDHYEALCEKLDLELQQVRKVGKNYEFEPTARGVDVRDLFQKARMQAESNEVQRRQAWEQLLDLESWDIQTPLMKLDLAYGTTSIFRHIAPAEQKPYEIEWHGRTIKGTVYMRDLADIARNLTPLPPINTADTDHDFAVFISNRPCGDKVAEIAARIKEPRALYWTPDDLTPAERDKLIDFAAYRQLVADYRGKDTAEAKDVLTWVADRLRGEIGTIYKIVPDSYGRGCICAINHSNLQFKCEGELGAILSPLVGQVLDAVYESASINFDAPAPFSDAEAIKVISGIVCPGEIPKGAKPTQYTSAAENYGYALGIMKKASPKKLDVPGCLFVEDIAGWIENQINQGNTPTVESVYKNFTGIGGPNVRHYGLSHRMIDLYLLTLVRGGKSRITLSGKSASIAPHLDLSNLADTPMNASLLGGMDQIQKLKAPEGWTVLAPYAAVLLGDKELLTMQRDTDIQQGLLRVQKYREEKRPQVELLIKRLTDLCTDIEQENPTADTLDAWKKFLDAQIDQADPTPHLLYTLDTAFGYSTYTDNESKQLEVDDLATRKVTWERAAAFCEQEREVRAAYRYSRLELSSSSVLANLRDKIKVLRKKLGKLEDLMESTPKLQSQLLDPLNFIRDSYKVRYMQAYDQATGKCEEVRSAVVQLTSSMEFQALRPLETIETFSTFDTASLRKRLESRTAGLFSTALDRNSVERALRDRPIPEECNLTVDDAQEQVDEAEQVEQQNRELVRDALLSAAKLLQQPALWSLLEQGKAEPFIADVLAATDADALADLLAERLSTDPELAKLLAKYLKMIQVRTIRFADFQPTKATVERSDVEQVVGEFRNFLEKAFEHNGQKESVIVEFKP